ncbi:hypothetical protein SLA_3506 [Streptomyces laurentii]|uniref:Uncharacterized protein n=1 Tax=Streptomyces laurentii TaxID=39478 RepID=A0A160P1B0_STRLU|nr:hypothetical protein SLA_3506 [Streptomyces laurentii]
MVRCLRGVRVAEVLRLAVRGPAALLLPLRLSPLHRLLPWLLPRLLLLLRVRRRGRLVPVRRLLRLLRLLSRGAACPAASVPESGHVHERTPSGRDLGLPGQSAAEL